VRRRRPLDAYPSDEAPSDRGRAGPALSRRQLLGGLGLAGSGLTLGAAAGPLVSGPASAAPPLGGAADRIYPFFGDHQAGIVTPAQDRLVFAALNVAEGASRDDLAELLRAWTPAAERMTRGQLVGEDTDLNDPPVDTGEAVGSAIGGLTITLGYGPSLFDDRFGLSARRPAVLSDLPPLPNEQLDPSYVGGDLCLQACSDDPMVAFHAVRNLARLGMGVVEYNWLQLGFGRTSSTTAAQATPRNLLGFKDGTRNIKAEETSILDDHVWVGPEADQPWMNGGSYLVARRIQTFLENWDRDVLDDQQRVIGRAKLTGAPLSGGSEFSTPDFKARDDQGHPLIPVDAHIRLASHEENGGVRILRRGYSFTDGMDQVRGTLLGGLFFIAFMKRPEQFITLQRRLGTSDALNEYTQHIGSALFAVPRGLRRGEHWGDGLLS
jgi:deferrochelatase/peroxidase EfeB